MEPVHSHTKWNSIELIDVDIESSEVTYDLHCITIEYNLITKSGLRFYYTSDLFEKNEAPPNLKPVIIDEHELEFMQKHIQDEFGSNPMEKFVQCFVNLTEICKKFPEKKFYLRTFNLSKFGDYQQFFAAEVIELVQIMIEKRGKYVEMMTNRLLPYRQRWTDTPSTVYAMNLDELQKILEHFDLDKRLITLVPDISFVDKCQYRMCVESGYSAATFPGPDGKEVMHVDQAMFVIFQAVVAEADWNETDVDDWQRGVIADFKKKLIHTMRACYLNRELHYLPNNYVLFLVAQLKRHNDFQRRLSLPITPLLELLYCEFDDQIKVSYIIEKCHQFGFGALIDKAVANLELKDELFPVYMARLIFMIVWLEDFFKDEHNDVKTRILEVFSTKMKFINDEVAGRLRYLVQRNLFDMEVDISRENGKQCYFTIEKFTHPRFTQQVINEFYSNKNIVKSWKWKFTKRSDRVVTSEIIEGIKKREVVKYMKNEKRMKERNEKAKEVVRKVMYEMLSYKREQQQQKEEGRRKEREKKKEEEDELDDIIEHAQLVERVRKQETVLRHIDVCRKKGPNQWRNLRQLRKIVQNALPNFMLSCIDALDE